MNKIAIIDDNFDQRETLRRSLEVYLENKDSKLQIIDRFPFQTFEEYYLWIKDENVICLIFDERMHNESEGDVGPVGYRGNELVTVVRERYKDIPVYVITSNKSDEELIAKFSEFEDIIERQEFINEGEKYVDRIIRASQRYLDENNNELEEFQELSKIIATGRYTEEQQSRLKALQTKLHLPLDINLSERKDWLDEYEERIKELEKLKDDIEKKINEN